MIHQQFPINNVGLSTLGLLVVIAFTGCDRDKQLSQPSKPRQFRIDLEYVDKQSRVYHVTASGADPAFWAAFVETDPSQCFTVYHQSSGTSQPAPTGVLGRYEVYNYGVVFLPTFPFLPGEDYLVEFNPDSINRRLREQPCGTLKTTIHIPDTARTSLPEIASIYPSSNSLPANHLKFYLLFSEPMEQGDIFRHFQLEDITEQKFVPRPFRHTELWSPDGKRLTLWFHPGRQKAGVNLNVEIGPVLNEGHEYRLIISKQWRSQNGVALQSDVVKQFRAVSKDRTQPDHKKWTVAVPAADTLQPVTCKLLESLDWALLHSEIHVENGSGEKVIGNINVSDNETVWSFVPGAAWKAGNYRLVIGTVLEDLAGNSLERPFEVDLDAEPRRPVGSTVYLEFQLSKAGQR